MLGFFLHTNLFLSHTNVSRTLVGMLGGKCNFEHRGHRPFCQNENVLVTDFFAMKIVFANGAKSDLSKQNSCRQKITQKTLIAKITAQT